MSDEREYVPEAVEAYNRGMDAFLMGDHAVATKFARKALAIDPGMVEATRMVKRLTPVVESKRDPVAMGMYGRGLDAYLSGDRGGAQQYASGALKASPGLVEAARLIERMKAESIGSSVNTVEPLRKAVKGMRRGG